MGRLDPKESENMRIRSFVKWLLFLCLMVCSESVVAQVPPDILEAFEGETITITTTHGLQFTGKLKKVNRGKKNIVFIQKDGQTASYPY